MSPMYETLDGVELKRTGEQGEYLHPSLGVVREERLNNE